METVNDLIDYNVCSFGYITAINVIRYFGDDFIDELNGKIPEKYLQYGFMFQRTGKWYVTGSMMKDRPSGEPAYLLRCDFEPLYKVSAADIAKVRMLALQADGLSNDLFDKITELAYSSRKLKELFYGRR